MRPGIQWKLMASHLVLVLLMGGVLYGYLDHTLANYLIAGIKENLLNEARLAALTASRENLDLRRDAPMTASTIGREIKARVTIMALNGEVAGDSEVRPDELKGIENHLYRPEVQAALKTGAGISIRHSSTLRTGMLYVAVPFSTKGREAGIIRLALPLAAVDKTRTSLHTILGASMALAVFLSLILSYIISRVTSRSLRTMASIAARIGKGEFGRRIPVNSRDELGELAGVMNDMSVRIERQLACISAEKNRLDTILRGMGEGLMVADAKGVITLVNPAFHTLFAIEEEVEGKPLIEITRHPDLNEAFRAVVTSRSERIEEITIRLPEETKVLTHWVPLLDQDALQGVVAVFHDISDIKKLENIRKDFVANVSHELRTPVTVIKGYAETLLGGVLETDPARARRFLEVIYNHSERLASLIGDLLTLSELESGKLTMELAPMTIEGTVIQAARLLEQNARNKGVRLILGDMHEVPRILADRGRLEQVLINLIDNGIKYTPAAGSVTVSATDIGPMVKLEVKDTGIGIPAKDLPRIFERFYRVDEARSRDVGGTGLGLSIVKHIVQLHGGTVAVESVAGKGSTFSFTLKKA
ncbi:MAG: two-component system OmpR family phosphate regulon sensor histidine kinase [Geobacteraceae bacterium]|nr:MAG: two-component system OmpR family phosphate regulon sensor histidine kinase [Geobacteraceae bacterium]